jgi:hypothetical protein
MSMAKPPKATPSSPKLCPILTAAVLRAHEESKIVGLDGTKKDGGYEAVPCAGPNCAFFTPVFGDDGQPRGGNCAITLIPTAVAMLNGTVAGAITNTQKV